MKRIQHLDGLRGVAILLVIGFHAFSRWSEIMPYGDKFKHFPLFEYGYLGVQLFFLLSGFVILATLERCERAPYFIYRRWLRLFPAMLICTLVILVTSGLFTQRPAGEVFLGDLIPGLTFIKPYFFNAFLGTNLESIEHSFWSLYVEFQFYIFSAIVYFIAGSRALVYALSASFIGWVVFGELAEMSGLSIVSKVHSLFSVLSFQHFGWFASGAAFYLFAKDRRWFWYGFGCVVSIVSAVVTTGLALNALVASLMVCLLFACSLVSQHLQALLSSRFLLFFGLISYPLYLLHENMMVSFTLQSAAYLPWLPSWLLPIVALAAISGLSYFIAKYGEVWVKNYIALALKKVAPRAGSVTTK